MPTFSSFHLYRHSRAGGNPEENASRLDSRFHGNDGIFVNLSTGLLCPLDGSPQRGYTRGPSNSKDAVGYPSSTASFLRLGQKNKTNERHTSFIRLHGF